MTRQWATPNGVVHIIPVDDLYDCHTWCNEQMTRHFAEKNYPPILVNAPPTCFVCIANEVHFYARPSIRSWHARRV